MIYKYGLTAADRQELILPKNAVFLDVQLQHGLPVLWAIVDTNNNNDVRIIRCYTTGNGHIPQSQLRYLGTIQQFNGDLVLHYFEEVDHA